MCILSDFVFCFTGIRSNCGQEQRQLGRTYSSLLGGNYRCYTFLTTTLKYYEMNTRIQYLMTTTLSFSIKQFSLLIFLIDFLSWLSFKFTGKWSSRYRDFWTTLPLTHVQHPSLSTCPTRELRLLRLIDLHWHIILT